MVLLGEVHHLEVVGERPPDALGRGSVERADRCAKLGRRLLAAGGGSSSLRYGSNSFLEIEERRPLQLDKGFAEDAAEGGDVATKGLEGIGEHAGPR